MAKRIRLNEAQLKQIIKEAVQAAMQQPVQQQTHAQLPEYLKMYVKAPEQGSPIEWVFHELALYRLYTGKEHKDEEKIYQAYLKRKRVDWVKIQQKLAAEINQLRKSNPSVGTKNGSRVLAEEFYGYGENGEMETYEGVHGRLDQALSELMQEYGFTGQEISSTLAGRSASNSKLQAVRDAIAEKLGGDREDAMKKATKIVLAWKRDFKDENARAQAGSVWHRQKEYGNSWLNSSPDDLDK